ncbi:MAG: hypothetical protein LC660_04495 [Desulfobacteraceae bacterium]|nr:hypothetical protein [Desulfobacteraceae bacterium]
MPLSFDSASHGPAAFGFFNIESDMLLLERFFFFCDDFCTWITSLADQASPALLDCESSAGCMNNLPFHKIRPGLNRIQTATKPGRQCRI